MMIDLVSKLLISPRFEEGSMFRRKYLSLNCVSILCMGLLP